MQNPIQYISLFSRSVSVLCNPFTMDLSRHYVNRPPFIQDCIRLFCSAEISFLQLYNWHFIQNAANRKGEKGDQIISWSSTHPPYPLIHHMTTPIAKAVINPSTILFGKYEKAAIRHFPCRAKSSSTSLIHPSIHRSTHHPCHPKSSSKIFIHISHPHPPPPLHGYSSSHGCTSRCSIRSNSPTSTMLPHSGRRFNLLVEGVRISF